MNRTQYIFLTALLLLSTGCGKHSAIPDEDTNVQLGSYIFFDAGLAETKGTLFSGNTLPGDPGTSFSVFGFRADNTTPIFTNHPGEVATVFRPEDSSASTPKPFTYDNLELWHSGTHSFYAYYTHESIPTSVISQIGSDESGHYLVYTQPTQLSRMTDLMMASTTATSAEGEVELVFNHRLSALDLVVRNSQTESEREIKINTAYIKLESIPSNGTLYFNGTTVPNNASFTELEHTYDIDSPITITYDNANKENSKHNLNSSNSFLFLPCDSIVATVTLTIINSWNEEVQLGITSQSLAPENGFVAGNRYYLIITKTEAGVEFRLDWANANGDWTNGPDPSFDFS